MQEIVTDVWAKAEELKRQRAEEKEKAKERSKSKQGLAKPKWGERRTSWKAADFDSVQALIEQAWSHKDEILEAKHKQLQKHGHTKEETKQMDKGSRGIKKTTE